MRVHDLKCWPEPFQATISHVFSDPEDVVRAVKNYLQLLDGRSP